MRNATLSCLLSLSAASGHSLRADQAAPAGVKATKAADLPTHRYAIQGKPSEAVQDLAAMRALASRVEQDLNAKLAALEDQDPAPQSGLHTALYLTAMVKGDPASARKHLEAVRSLQEGPLRKRTTGLITMPLIQAQENPGPDFRATFRSRLAKGLAELPYAETRFTVEAIAGNLKSSSKARIIEGVTQGLDGRAEAGHLSEDAVIGLLAAAMNLHVLLPVREDAFACLDAHLQSHKADSVALQVSPTPLGTREIKAKGPHFGQSHPGNTPLPFAPEVLKAVSPWVAGIAFSPDGTECFLSIGSENYSGGHIFQTTCVEGSWTPLSQPDFLGGFAMSGEAIYAKDGQQLTFTGIGKNRSVDFWTVKRSGGGWGVPLPMPAPINTEAKEFRGSTTTNGVLYFGSDRSSPGINQVHRATRKGGHEWIVEQLGAPINSLSYEGDPCVAPDGSWIVFYSGRPGGFGGTDLYISFSDGKGSWGTPVNLGPEFNSPAEEWGACLSTDGKFLFFTRHGAKESGLFWVSVKALEKFRK